MDRADGAAGLDLVEGFLDTLWMEYGLSPATLAAYRSDLQAFARWLAGRDVTLLNARRENILDYLAEKVAAQARPRTTARVLSSLRRFYRWQVREGRMSE